jgi:hypothetical protein
VKPRILVAICIAAASFLSWRFLGQERTDGLGPIRSFEAAIGQTLVSAMQAHPPKGVVLVIDRVYQSAQAEPSRVTGIRDALKKLGVSGEAISIEYIERDPMDAQAGNPSFPFSALIQMLPRHPEADALVVWSDIPFPAEAERQALQPRGIRIYIMGNNAEAAAKMVQAGAIAGALVPRREIKSTPGGMPDIAKRVANEYELLMP